MFQTRVRVGQDDRLRQISELGTGRVFLGSLLKAALPGISSRKTSFIWLRRHDCNNAIYSQYRGGHMWKPTARELGSKGEEFPLSIGLLTKQQFLDGIGTLTMRNEIGVRWIADTCRLQIVTRKSELMIECSQSPPVEGCSSFTVSGRTASAFQQYNDCVRLDLTVKDILGNRRNLALFHDGRRNAWMGIDCGSYFSRVFMISSDGIRTRFVYGGSREFNVAVLYESDPSRLYSFKWGMRNLETFIDAKENMNIIGEVKLARSLEQKMEAEGTAYDHGRLGAEIAYVVTKELIKPTRVLLFEPSRGGKDLCSEDEKLVVQARMLVRTRKMSGVTLKNEIMSNLRSLLFKLEQDFRYNTLAVRGLAVLTFVNHEDTVKLISCLRLRTAPRPSFANTVQMALNH